MQKNINWIAVAIAVVASMLIGFLWYGLIFNETWMAGNSITMEGEKMFKNGSEIPMSSMPMILNTISMVIYAVFMSWLIQRTGHFTFLGGATLGATIGLIMVVGIFISNTFAIQPLSLTAVDGSYSFVLWTLIGAIIGGIRKK